MACEDVDAVTEDRMAAAVELLLRLRSESPAVAMRELAVRVVDAIFCTCVKFGSDAVACRLERVYPVLVSEVMQRAQAAIASTAPWNEQCDRIDMAAEQPFCAGNWSAWLWR